GAFGGTLANVWMHCGPLMVDADKMSKSLGNFRTIRETVAVPGSLSEDSASYEANPREAEMLRFFIVRNHYRSVQNYTPDTLRDALAADDLLYLTAHCGPAHSGVETDWNQPEAQVLRSAMDDDLNTSGAVVVLVELASKANRER